MLTFVLLGWYLAVVLIVILAPFAVVAAVADCFPKRLNK